VRIIGGEYRGRRIAVPERRDLRPTPDRVRETLFNWLGQVLEGKSCLDLFAGSGALGFEALSRGAKRVVMVEQDRETARALRESAAALEAANLEIVESDAMRFLDASPERFDIAFVDPPYNSKLVGSALVRLPRHLNPGGRVYAESAERIELPLPWRPVREDRAGAVHFGLYECTP
jgi:16S rRNA (guanine966-N2)-methyltransferase